MAVATVKLHTISGNQSDAHERTRPPAGSFPLCAVGVPWRLLDSRFGRFASGLPYVGDKRGKIRNVPAERQADTEQAQVFHTLLAERPGGAL